MLNSQEVGIATRRIQEEIDEYTEEFCQQHNLDPEKLRVIPIDFEEWEHVKKYGSTYNPIYQFQFRVSLYFDQESAQASRTGITAIFGFSFFVLTLAYRDQDWKLITDFLQNALDVVYQKYRQVHLMETAKHD